MKEYYFQNKCHLLHSIYVPVLVYSEQRTQQLYVHSVTYPYKFSVLYFPRNILVEKSHSIHFDTKTKKARTERRTLKIDFDSTNCDGPINHLSKVNLQTQLPHRFLGVVQRALKPAWYRSSVRDVLDSQPSFLLEWFRRGFSMRSLPPISQYLQELLKQRYQF